VFGRAVVCCTIALAMSALFVKRKGTDESPSVRQTDVRALPRHQAPRQGDGHLPESETQATAGVNE
jgi:hypothetical protein